MCTVSLTLTSESELPAIILTLCCVVHVSVFGTEHQLLFQREHHCLISCPVQIQRSIHHSTNSSTVFVTSGVFFILRNDICIITLLYVTTFSLIFTLYFLFFSLLFWINKKRVNKSCHRNCIKWLYIYHYCFFILHQF